MFDFKKEVNKFRPMTEVGDLENNISENEMQDIMDLLRISAEKPKKTEKKAKDKDKDKKE